MPSHASTLPVILLTGLLGACGGAPPTTTTKAEGPTPVQYTEQKTESSAGDCSQPEGHCAQISIRYQQAVSGGTDAVCESVDLLARHQLVSWMRARLPEGQRAPTDLPALADAWLATYRAFIADNPGSVQRWSLDAACTVPYNTPVVTTIDCRIQEDSGGAHPNSRRRLASFAVSSGELLAPADVVTDTQRLDQLAEKAFRTQRGLQPGEDLSAAGFTFPDDTFALTDNFGATPEGLLFHWDATQIAPYAEGPTNVLVPAQELEGMTAMDLWPAEKPQ
jgi:hypothetical protein